MTRNEILRRFPNASEAFIKSNSVDGEGVGPHPRKEKLQDDNSSKERTLSADNQARIPEGDKEGSGVFQVAITLHFSDKRRRDLTNGAETILDALITARRLLDTDTDCDSISTESKPRKRRGDSNHNPNRGVKV